MEPGNGTTPDGGEARMPSQAHRALAVLEDLRRAGLPVRDSVIYTGNTDPDGVLGTSSGPEEKVAFIDARINPDRVLDRSYGSIELGGVVEVYSDAAGVVDREETFNGPCWVFMRDSVLLRLSPRLTELQTFTYAAVFRDPLLLV